MEYDCLNRLTTVTNTEGEKQCYYYDCMGRLTEVKRHGSEDIQTTKYDWNLEGRLIKKTDALRNVETFTYDRCGIYLRCIKKA